MNVDEKIDNRSVNLDKFDEEGGSRKNLQDWNLKLVAIVAISWSLFQLWYASPLPYILNFGKIIDVPARSLHLAFGLVLCFLIYPTLKSKRKSKISTSDFVLVFISLLVTLYIFFDYEGLVYRQGILAKIQFGSFTIPYELIIGALGIVLLLEATRRAIGIPLVTIALIFLLFSVFGQSMPYIISHQGLSITRLVGYHWFGGEAIFGIPISVSVSFIFLFVLFHFLNFSPNIVLIGVVIVFLISLYAVNIFIKDMDNKDPKEVVIDEFIGQSIPICLYEIAHEGTKETNEVLTFYFIMFILFRIFDIVKPYPVSYYDKNFKNSFGVIMDDVCAGLYVVVVLVLYMVITS